MVQIFSGKILPGDAMRLVVSNRFCDVPITLWIGMMAEDLIRYARGEGLVGIFREVNK